MQKKLIIKIAGVVLLCLISFWVGRLSISYQVITYSADDRRIAFHLDSPSEGLPLVEYQLVLSEFRSGDSERALSHLEMFLDGAVRSAEHRRPLLRGWRLEQFDKALAKVAQYREQHPRPLSQGTGFLWTAERQTEVDTFLRGFAKQ